MRHIYTLLFYLAIPFILLRLYWRGRLNPDYRHRWAERFGLFPALPTAGCIWIHGVSVGEVRAALPLIRALKTRYPQQPLLVTTTTPTGSQQVQTLLGNSVQHAYLPFDLPAAVARFLARTHPRLALIMETELWPNLFHQCAANHVPLIVANARLSPRSARNYGRLPGLIRRMLSHTTLIAAQTEADAARFRGLGASRVEVMGNLKYDLNLPRGLAEQGRKLRYLLGAHRPVLIAASTHAAEEAMVVDAFVQIRRALPPTLLLWAPRHPERFEAVAERCQRWGLNVVKRSEARSCAATTAVFLGDSLGELLLFYSAADVAFVGGSLTPHGGHNVLEPALLGLPVVFGPHMLHFGAASQHLLAAGAAWQVADARELAVVVERLLHDPISRQTAGQRGRQAVIEQRGALERLLAHIATIYAPSVSAAYTAGGC